jgi:hypothetical protein
VCVCVCVCVYVCLRWDRIRFPFSAAQSVPLLEASGHVLMLPFSHPLAFARHCAHHGLTNFRRYCVAPVFHKVDAAADTTRMMMEASFDMCVSLFCLTVRLEFSTRVFYV